MKRILTLILAVMLAATSIIISGAEPSAVLSAKDDSTIVVDGNIIRNVAGIPSASELVAQLVCDGGEITVVGIEADERVPNGTKVICGGNEYTVVITGDLYPDAKINARDIIALLRAIVSVNPDAAADVNLDSKVNAKDVVSMLKHITGWDDTFGAQYFEYNTDPITAESEDKAISIFFGDDLTKVDKKDSRASGTTTDMIRLAKNEIAFTQFFLTAKDKRNDLTVTATDFVSIKGDHMESELLTEYYFKVNDAQTGKQVYYADALPPASVYSFIMNPGENQGFVIKAKSTADTPAGLYRSKISVRSGGRTVKRADVYAMVWNFALSDDTSCATAFGLSRYNIYKDHNLYQGDGGILYENYYNFMLENRVSAYYLPYSVLDERADEYMSNPRVTSFMIDGRDHPNAGLPDGENGSSSMTDAELEAAYEKLSKNPDWMKKGYFYYVDEPWSAEMLNDVADTATRLKAHFPDYRLTVPYLNGNIAGYDSGTFMRDAGVNLWCPLSDLWTHSDCTVPGANRKFTAAEEQKYGTSEQRFASYVENGDELWWYVCIIPQYPYANLFSTYQGTRSRVLLWQQYMYNVDGLLYWAVNDWQNGAEWRSMDVGFKYGDGRLLYCGAKYGVYGPISSIRMEYLRDAIEDYEYLKMAEQLCGRDAVNKILNRVTTGILDFTDDPTVLRAARDELGNMIAANIAH